MEKAKNKGGIAKFIRERFHERYIQPFENNSTKHGFIMMASACLMVEALESFWNGWHKSPNSSLVFCQFFDRQDRFSLLRGHAQEFYGHVRCGILHQAETTGGWHIRRDLGVLFDSPTKTVDATVFLKAMDGSLIEYCGRLNGSAWKSEEWKKLRKKMKGVCAILKNQRGQALRFPRFRLIGTPPVNLAHQMPPGAGESISFVGS